MRRVGGGRKPLIETDPGLLTDLNALIEPDARGDPMSPLRWTCKSLRRLAGELREIGHKISHISYSDQGGRPDSTVDHRSGDGARRVRCRGA